MLKKFLQHFKLFSSSSCQGQNQSTKYFAPQHVNMTESSQFLRKSKMRHKIQNPFQNSSGSEMCSWLYIYMTIYMQYLILMSWYCMILCKSIICTIYLHGYRFCMFAFDAPTLDCRNCCRKQAMAICTGDCHRTYCCWQSCGTCTSRCGWPPPMPSHGICRLQFCRCKFIGSTNYFAKLSILSSTMLHGGPIPSRLLPPEMVHFLVAIDRWSDIRIYGSMIIVKKDERSPDWLTTNRFVITFIAKLPLYVSGHASSLLVMHCEAFVSGAALFYKVLGKYGIMFWFLLTRLTWLILILATWQHA